MTAYKKWKPGYRVSTPDGSEATIMDVVTVFDPPGYVIRIDGRNGNDKRMWAREELRLLPSRRS